MGAPGITCSGLAALNINLGSGNDTFNVTGSQVIQFGAPNSQGVAPVVLPKSGGVFNPIHVGISGVDVEGARRNLDGENPGPDFDSIRREAERAWERELSKISVEAGSTAQRTVASNAPPSLSGIDA